MTENQHSANRRAFLSAPDAARYFPGGAIEEARQKLTHNLERSAGVALVIGGAGLGKSMLLEVLAAQFGRERTTITLAGAQLCTRRALLQVILFQLGLPFRDLTEGELRLSILSHLKQQSATSPNQGAGQLLLLVDEAESLPVRLLEELRVLTNVAHAGTPLVDLILAGGPSLEERFTEPELETFNQRVTLRCYVAPLGREETFQYVRSQVAASGGNPAELFSQDALEAIYSATDGIPRLVNQLGDQLAWMAEQTGYKPIDAALVQQAWAELQQLPAPWNMDDGPQLNRTPAPFHRESEPEQSQQNQKNEQNAIEFGDLSDGSAIEIGGPFEISSDEDEDSMPASIPFGSSKAGSHSHSTYDAHLSYDDRSTHEDSSDATIDATEKLLAELGEIGGGDPEFAPHETVSPHEARSAEAEGDGIDPFGGVFEEEEVIIDPYANFEAEMLSFAPDVMNFLDVGFAEGLNRVTPNESHSAPQKPALATVVCDEPAIAKRLDDEPIEPTELDVEEVAEAESKDEFLVLESVDLHMDDCFGAFDEDESVVSTTAYFERQGVPHQPMPAASPNKIPAGSANKILVLEDDGRALAEVVPGRQFRRLFSGLEAGS